MKTLRDRMNELDPARRARVDARAANLHGRNQPQRVQGSPGRSQARVSRSRKITQDGLSRIEKRSDLLLSTLRKNVETMGGHLRLVDEFRGRAPLVLTGFQRAALEIRRARKRRSTSH